MKAMFYLLAIASATYYGWTHYFGPTTSTESLSTASIQALATTVKAHEVTLYSTNECPYAQAAKGWLAQNGFAFTECNMSVNQRCVAEFKAYGADGTPFLVIRRGPKEHHMKNGFDSDEFLAALQR